MTFVVVPVTMFVAVAVVMIEEFVSAASGHRHQHARNHHN